MKISLLIVFILGCGFTALSQRSNCVSKTDSNAVVRIAKKKRIYWTENWQCQPALKLDSLNCKWTLTTCKIGHSTKGDCKYTNGCTVSTTATLVVNAITGKIVLLEKKVKLYPNYE